MPLIANRMTTTESLLPELINDFCNKIGTFETPGDVRFSAATGVDRTLLKRDKNDARDP